MCVPIIYVYVCAHHISYVRTSYMYVPIPYKSDAFSVPPFREGSHIIFTIIYVYVIILDVAILTFTTFTTSSVNTRKR